MLSRRGLLRDAALAIAGCAAAPVAASSRGSRPAPRLIIIRLRGGADGLTMVPPWGDRGYARARPTLAVPAPASGSAAAIDLDGYFGLHPSLAALATLFHDRQLDVWPACGFARDTRSHLLADEMLDRALADLGGRVIAPLETEVAGYPVSPFGRSLARACDDVAAGRAPRVLVVESRGWDHHSGEAGARRPLDDALEDLGAGLAAVTRGLGSALSHTTIVTVSEFGRAIAENAHRGSEHGHATAMFVAGGAVRRGRIVAPWPGLGSSGVIAPTMLVPDALGVLA